MEKFGKGKLVYVTEWDDSEFLVIARTRGNDIVLQYMDGQVQHVPSQHFWEKMAPKVPLNLQPEDVC